MSKCNDTCKYYKHCWRRVEGLKEDGEECARYEPDRPHGEWKQVTAKDGEYYFYHQCTNCGQTIESGFDNPPLFNFCPNCGSDNRKMGEASD